MPSVTRRESNKKVPSAKHRHNHRRHGGMRSDGGGVHAAIASVARNTCHFTSGRKSSQRTAPPVACSIAGQCSAGMLPRAIQLLIVCGLPSMAFAKAVCDPKREIAFKRDSMSTIIHTWWSSCQHVESPATSVFFSYAQSPCVDILPHVFILRPSVQQCMTL